MLQALYGNIYSEVFEDISCGGPICYNDMSTTFRIGIALFSMSYGIPILKWTHNKLKDSDELNTNIGKKPNSIEVVFGLASIATIIIQVVFKLYTGRGIFILNPCHIVVIAQIFLFLLPKTKTLAFVYIGYMRWLYGTYLALVFPSFEGLDLYFEKELFWIEHLMGTFTGPMVLVMCGRYGYPTKNKYWYEQLFGWYTHIFYMRMILLPLSLITWANLNFTLCRPKADFFVPYIGNWYYILAEFYLHLISITAYWFTYLLGRLLYLSCVRPIEKFVKQVKSD